MLQASTLLYSVRSALLDAKLAFAKECIMFVDKLCSGSAWCRRIVSNAMVTHLPRRNRLEYDYLAMGLEERSRALAQ